jgi:hypothetical protein
MRTRRFAIRLGCSAIGVLASAAAVFPVPAGAQERMQATAHEHEQTAEQRQQLGALIKIVRDATERFKDITAAEADGYALQFGCVSGSDAGAMGMHFVKGALVGDDVIDPARPEIVIYEPKPDGRLKLIGADFLVLKDVWDAKHAAPPQLMGQLFHLFDAPNRFGLPAFYTLHVWAWKENPNGSFVNWHPNVTCDGFTGGTVPPDPGPDGPATSLPLLSAGRRIQ